MNKLSQEAEDYINQQDYSVLVDKDKNAIYRFGMKAALINPILLEKQGLISLEGFELLITKMFLQYEAAQCIALTTGEKFEPSEWLKNQIQIYQEQKEKK